MQLTARFAWPFCVGGLISVGTFGRKKVLSQTSVPESKVRLIVQRVP